MINCHAYEVELIVDVNWQSFYLFQNGLYSMIPYLAFWVMISLAGMFADLLIEKEILTIKWTRKLFCAIGIKGSNPLGFISYFYSARTI